MEKFRDNFKDKFKDNFKTKYNLETLDVTELYFIVHIL